MAVIIDSTFFRMFRPVGWHVRPNQAEWRRDLWNSDKEQKAEVGENMSHVFCL